MQLIPDLASGITSTDHGTYKVWSIWYTIWTFATQRWLLTLLFVHYQIGWIYLYYLFIFLRSLAKVKLSSLIKLLYRRCFSLWRVSIRRSRIFTATSIFLVVFSLYLFTNYLSIAFNDRRHLFDLRSQLLIFFYFLVELHTKCLLLTILLEHLFLQVSYEQVLVKMVNSSCGVS